MVGGRRAVVAVLATAAAVLAVGQSSSGIQPPTPSAAGDPPSVGATARTGVHSDGTEAAQGTSSPMISGNGRWQVFASSENLDPSAPGTGSHTTASGNAPNLGIFARDLVNHTTIQLSVGRGSGGAAVAPDGNSFSPSISDDGRFIAFYTNATNIAATGVPRLPLALVLCDRDPNGDGTFDDPSDPDLCKTVYATTTAAQDRIHTADPPAMEGFGGVVAWTQDSDTGTHVWYRQFTVPVNGTLTLLDPQQLRMLINTPAACTDSSGSPSEDQPAVAQNGSEIVVRVSWPLGCTAIVGTNNLGAPDFAQSTRYDRVPTGCGSGFLGDLGPLTGPCAVGSGGDLHFVSNPSVASFGSSVLFHFEDGPVIASFATPQTEFASNTNPVDWMVLTRDNGATSDIVSRDNSGAIVNDSPAGAISEDGRFVVFETASPDTSDGADIGGTTAVELVARDVVLDDQRANATPVQPRLPGALVTPRDASLAPPTGCTPAAGQLCESTESSVSSISLDGSGTHVSFNSFGSDLVAGDTNASSDSFVRTWQPALSDVQTDAGTVQVNTSLQINVPVTVTGFGPVVLGATSTDSPEFVPGATTCQGAFTLHTGDNCTVSVVFSPTSTGAKTAHVFVDSEQYGAPAEVATVTADGAPTGPVTAPADTTRTSVRDNGGQSATGGDESMISGNGRWQAFVSSTELTGRSPVDQQQPATQNVYVRDLADPQHTVQISLHTAATVNGDPSVPSRPVFVSGHPTGASPNGDSFEPSISSDGRFVSFMTTATDIVPSKFRDDSPAANSSRATVVVCDRDPDRDGIFDEVRPGTQIPDYRCFAVESGSFAVQGRSADEFTTPRLAGNGTRITWVEDDGAQDAQRAVVSTLLKAPGGVLQAPSDPAYVPINGVNGFTASAGGPSSSDALQQNPRLTQDGGAVLFAAQLQCCPQTTSAAVIETTLADGSSVRFDTTDNGATFLGDGGGFFGPPAMSDDGTRVAFAFQGPSDNVSRVYVATLSGSTIDTVLASVDNNGAPSAGSEPALSGNGRYLAFQSSQPNESNAVDPPNGSCFVNDRNANVNCQIVARDLAKDAAQRAANLPLAPSEIVSSRGIDDKCPNPLPAGRKCGANNESFNPSIDRTGSEIGFDSDASDIVPGDNNQDCGEGCFPATDAFVHTWRPTLATPSFDFGTVLLGDQATKTFTVTEQALAGVDHIFGPISLGKTSITGGNAPDFKLVSTTCTGKTLNDGKGCTYQIRFTPSVAGNRSATLATAVGKNGYPRSSPDNISFDPPPTLPATLTGVGSRHIPTKPHVGQLTVPATLDFGKRLPLAPPLTKTLTVTDTGTGSVAITNIAVGDTTHPGASGDYTVSSACPAVLPPGGSCTIAVSFVGHAVGNRAARLVVTNDAPGGPKTVALLAEVPKPKVTANPGVATPGRVTMISGTGFAPNREVDVELKGFVEHAVGKTDAHGAFDVSLVIFRSTPQGPQTITGHTHGVSRTISASGPLLLTLGSIDNLQLVTRH